MGSKLRDTLPDIVGTNLLANGRIVVEQVDRRQRHGQAFVEVTAITTPGSAEVGTRRAERPDQTLDVCTMRSGGTKFLNWGR